MRRLLAKLATTDGLRDLHSFIHAFIIPGSALKRASWPLQEEGALEGPTSHGDEILSNDWDCILIVFFFLARLDLARIGVHDRRCIVVERGTITALRVA